VSINWTAVGSYVYGNRVPIISALTLMISAAVKTAPIPGAPFNLYTWVYDFFHQFLNITNTRLTPTQVITPPASNAAPQPLVEVKKP
jgi:hypothetical protein